MKIKVLFIAAAGSNEYDTFLKEYKFIANFNRKRYEDQSFITSAWMYYGYIGCLCAERSR